MQKLILELLVNTKIKLGYKISNEGLLADPSFNKESRYETINPERNHNI